MKSIQVVKVTRNHILAGRRFNPRKCPIALALMSAGFYKAQVTGLTVNARRRGDRRDVTWEIPNRAVEFITRFDNGDPVQPFELRLTPMSSDITGRVEGKK